jgi:hypothetical protein
MSFNLHNSFDVSFFLEMISKDTITIDTSLHLSHRSLEGAIYCKMSRRSIGSEFQERFHRNAGSHGRLGRIIKCSCRAQSSQCYIGSI